MGGDPTVGQLGWRLVRQMLSGIGWGLLGFFLVPLAISPPFVDWLRSSAMGEVSPAHDLLTGYLRSYWGVVLILAIGAAIQVRLIAVTVLRFFRDRPEEKALEGRLEDEFISLTCLSGFGPDRRRKELKEQLDQFSAIAVGRFMDLLIQIALAIMVLVWYGTILFMDAPAPAPIAPLVHIPQLQAELEQVERGQLETAEVWIHPNVESGRLPGMWGSGYRSLTLRCHIISTEPGSHWIDILVPRAMEFSPSGERPFRESQSIPWNLEHAQRYRVSYTSNFHLAAEITPIP
ncbi:MAG: hypothetical protein HFF44_00830 [Lawsonibacter sp.]|nr:hypothetical protein [Lawsonibacter sp.]